MKAQRALLLGHYDIYPVGQHDFVQNLYCLSSEVETTPLLGARLLQALADVPRDEHEGALLDVEKLVALGQMMDVEEHVTRVWLDALLKTGLCVNYDPTVLDQQAATRIEITPSGRLHLNWARSSFEYICAMGVVTPLLDEGVHFSISQAYEHRNWRQVAARFVHYLSAEDKMHCRLPDHSAYAGQRRMLTHLSELADVWSRPRPEPVSNRGGASTRTTKRN